MHVELRMALQLFKPHCGFFKKPHFFCVWTQGPERDISAMPSQRKRIMEASTAADMAVISKKTKLDSWVVSQHLANTQISYAHAHTLAIALSDTLSLC